MLTAARRVVAAQTFLLDAHRAGAAEGVDAEHLHELRVAARRLRFALRLLGPLLGRAAEDLRDQLASFMLPMGGVRDLDVLLAALPRDLGSVDAGGATAERVVGLFRELRVPAQQRLARALLSRRFDRLLAGLRRFAAPAGELGAPGRADHESVRVGAARLLRRAGRRALRAAEPPLRERTAEQLHAARIAVRRFRYACEYFGPVFGRSVRAARDAAVALQDRLGAIHDADVALERLRGAAAAVLGAGHSDVDAVLTLGALSQLHRRRAAKARRELPELASAFRRMAGRVVRRLG